ncbi:MAG: ATPase [Calditrichaeota bacterium]|nr:MAG: ATPase [Calditrichota bacterium]
MLGETKYSGFQYGIRRTFHVPLEKAWDYMFSDEGLALWLGHPESPLAIRKHYKTREGTEGIVRIFKPRSHVRLSWKPTHWDNFSTVQLRFIGDDRKTTISIHQEKLSGPEQRVEMKRHWSAVMEKIKDVMNHLAHG